MKCFKHVHHADLSRQLQFCCWMMLNAECTVHQGWLATSQWGQLHHFTATSMASSLPPVDFDGLIGVLSELPRQLSWYSPEGHRCVLSLPVLYVWVFVFLQRLVVKLCVMFAGGMRDVYQKLLYCSCNASVLGWLIWLWALLTRKSWARLCGFVEFEEFNDTVATYYYCYCYYYHLQDNLC